MNFRILVVSASLAAGFAVVSVAHADKAKIEQRYCAALGDFHADLKALQSIEPSTTLRQMRDAASRVSDDARRVEKEGRRIGTPTAKKFREAASQLKREAFSLPDTLTIAQAQSRIEGDVQNVEKSSRQLAAESGCPQPEGPKQKAESVFPNL